MSSPAKVARTIQETTMPRWRNIPTPIGPSCTPQECWVIQEKEPAIQWLILKPRVSSETLLTHFEIFNKFLTDELLDAIVKIIDPRDLIINMRTNSKGLNNRFHCMKISLRDAWQAIAAQVRIIGRQEKQTVNPQSKRPLYTNLQEARAHFATVDISGRPLKSNKDKGTCCGIEKLYKMTGFILIGSDFVDAVSQNFCNFVHSLGQYLAGDEKYWGFYGKSDNLRLSILNNDKNKFLFYGLYAMFSNGLPYLLHASYPDKSSVYVSSIVQSWVNVILTIGKDDCGGDENPNPLTILAMDSFCMDSSTRDILLESGIKFIAFVKAETEELLLLENRRNWIYDTWWNGMVKDATGELMVLRHDLKTHLSKHYYSKCFVHTKDENKCRDMKGCIPAYNLHKQMFIACDHFYSALYNRHFPHKRGGSGIFSYDGEHHDLMMACILQNTFNAYHHLTSQNSTNTDFKTCCETLADQIYVHSFKFE